VLCCVVLCYGVCFVVLCCVMVLCCVVLWCVLCCVVLCCVMLCAVLCCVMLCAVLCRALLCCVVLYKGRQICQVMCSHVVGYCRVTNMSTHVLCRVGSLIHEMKHGQSVCFVLLCYVVLFFTVYVVMWSMYVIALYCGVS